MAEVINTNVFDAEKKFVDFAGLDYFWEKAKAYVDGADKAIDDKVIALEGVVGDSTKGLIKDFNDLKAYTESLGDIEGGEGLGGMIDSKIAALDVEDAAVDGQYVSSVAEVDGKVVVTRANLPVYEEVGVAKDFNDAMDERVKVLEAIDHEKLAADASAAAVATVLDGAPESFDTLKEVAAWIANNDHASDVATLVTDVENLKKIDHDAYKAADTEAIEIARIKAASLALTAETQANKYTDDKIAALDLANTYDAKGAAEAAETAAKSYADGLVMVDGVAKFEAAGTAASAIAALDLPNTYDAKGAAADAQAAAIAQAKADAAETLKSYYTKDEVDGFVDALNGNIESAQAAAEAYAKTYTDALFTSFQFAANSDIDALFAPKAEA